MQENQKRGDENAQPEHQEHAAHEGQHVHDAPMPEHAGHEPMPAAPMAKHAAHEYEHKAHASHVGHEQMFRRRFWVSLLLSIPVLVFTPAVQGLLHA